MLEVVTANGNINKYLLKVFKCLILTRLFCITTIHTRNRCWLFDEKLKQHDWTSMVFTGFGEVWLLAVLLCKEKKGKTPLKTSSLFTKCCLCSEHDCWRHTQHIQYNLQVNRNWILDSFKNVELQLKKVVCRWQTHYLMEFSK